MSYIKAGETNMPPTPNNGPIIQQNLTTGQNFRIAVGFLSGKLPNVQNLSSFFQGSSQLLKIIGVQAQIDRTNRSNPVYSEQVYTFVPCPSNYLNDGNKFLDQNFGVQESIQMGYCVPDNLTIQLYGDSDTSVQRWFYLSVAMLNCTGCNTVQAQAQRINASSFFSSYTPRLYLSDPIVDKAQLTYGFQRIIFGKLSATLNNVQNVSIDQLQLVDDMYLLQPPDVINSMNYIYLVNSDSSYVYSDPATLFKNLTFAQTGNLALYTHTYLKADQILGMLGGFSFFAVLIFRYWVRRYNKFKMYL